MSRFGIQSVSTDRLHGRQANQAWWAWTAAYYVGLSAMLASPVYAQSGSDVDAGATCFGTILAVAVLAGIAYWRTRARQNAFRDKNVETLQDESDLEPIPDSLSVELTEAFQAINWSDSEHIPPLQATERVIFHTMLKELLVRKLVLHREKESTLDWTDTAFLTGTDRQIIVSAGTGRNQQVLLAVPWSDVSECSAGFGPRRRSIGFRSGQSLDIEFGLPESLLDKHTTQFTTALVTIIAAYRKTD